MAVLITLTESSQQVMFSVAKRKSKSKQVWKFKLVYTQCWISFSVRPVRGAGVIPMVWPICKLPTSCIPSTCVGHPKSVLKQVGILRIFVATVLNGVAIWRKFCSWRRAAEKIRKKRHVQSIQPTMKSTHVQFQSVFGIESGKENDFLC